MADIEKVIKAIDICLGHGKCNDCSYHSGANYSDQNCRGRMLQDALALLKEQEEVEPQDAEMLIIHNGGAEEYVKDIESIVLLAHTDYDIVYCGTFGRSVKRNELSKPY